MSNGLEFNFRRAHRGGVENEQMDQLKSCVSDVQLSSGDDSWCWNLETDGIFSVASIRKAITSSICIVEGDPTRWCKLVPIKVNLLAWRIGGDNLPTRFNMSLRGLDIQSMDCPVCKERAETTNHLFFSCSFAGELIRKTMNWWDFPITNFDSWNSWKSWLDGLKFNREMKDYVEATFLVLWWSIWNFRNKLIFTSKKVFRSDVFNSMVSQAYLWCNHRGRRKLDWSFWIRNPKYALM